MSLCIALELSYSVGQRWNRERGISAPDMSLGVQRLCSARIGICYTASMSGGSAKRFSIENPGACPRRARDGWVETSRSVVPLDLHPCYRSVILGVAGWVKINGKLTVMLEMIERASGWVVARRRPTTCRVPPFLLTPRRSSAATLRFATASSQNIDTSGSRAVFRDKKNVLKIYIFLVHTTTIAIIFSHTSGSIPKDWAHVLMLFLVSV